MDGSLGNSVLEMGINATKSKSLSLLRAVVYECIVGKSSIGGVIVFDVHKIVGGELLESQF